MDQSRCRRVVRARLAVVGAAACAFATAACTGANSAGGGTPATLSSRSSATSAARPTTSTPGGTALRQTVIATNLDVPWGLAFLPDGTALVTLRDRAEVVRIGAGGTTSVASIPGVEPEGEGGLLGIALSPGFTTDHQVFLYFTAARDNRIVRATYDGGRLTGIHPIFTGIPRGDHHDGGRIAFGPDGFLYAGTGDAGDSEQAQDRSALGGKILRLTSEGRPAPGNPFPGSPVWSYGHRNVQGLAWDASGRMFASEFGQNTWDELNEIVPGGNYGWPRVEGIANDRRFRNPLHQWSTADASPSGITIGPDGAVYMAALRGQALWRIPLAEGRVGEPQRLLADRYGRLRTVERAPDGRLWVVTSNTFRGNPRPGDDRVIAFPVTSLR
jgi:glucose/arabinose dehydrogenase